jgi:hypothetical protein
MDQLKRWIAAYFMKEAMDPEGFDPDKLIKDGPAPALWEEYDPVPNPDNREFIARLSLLRATKTSEETWREITATADRHNDAGNFTALIGWEWSSTPIGSNLHRVIFTPDGAETANQFIPFSSLESQYPEDLWQWLAHTSEKTSARFVSIPHNSNISKGYMFPDRTLHGEPLNEAYLQSRARWEPVTEITQFKGTSETHPELSPQDRFAGFELFPYYIQSSPETYVARPGDYVRSALKLGLQLEETLGGNPYQFGFIGSSDAHTALASVEESNMWGKVAYDSIPENKIRPVAEDEKINVAWDMSASGLAAVWAESNTREAIYSAFKRREVYATTGPRIAVRFFGGWDFPATVEDIGDIGKVGRDTGVPMGGQLVAPPDNDDRESGSRAPQFLIEAFKDPTGANLDRVQMVKGWVDAAGKTHEKIFNVAWSGTRALGTDDSLAPVGSTVNIDSGSYDNSIGSASLITRWQDPEFDPTENAFYYLRVIEIPTPRHSLLDAIALQVDPASTEKPATIQERAFTSPIWYRRPVGK